MTMQIFSTVLASVILFVFGVAIFEVQAGPLDTPGASKAMVCSACHGFGGNSPGNTLPILAAMAPSYFKKAITDYAQGRRVSPEMEPYSKYVMQAGIDEIADYFAVQLKRPAKSKVNPAAVKRGAALGSQCENCHGSKGEGDAFRAIPALQGQPAGYLREQLTLWKADRRKLEIASDEQTKKAMLKPLSDADLSSLAAYFATVK
jgi:cytochrome c553